MFAQRPILGYRWIVLAVIFWPLFERFRRGPNAPGFGAGLGLPIARCIMERQGGHLSLDPDTDRGARFVIGFPAPGEPEHPA